MSFVKDLKHFRKIALTFSASAFLTGVVHAAPVTYATIGSSSYFTNQPGIFTLDLANLTYSGQFESNNNYYSYMTMLQTGPASYDANTLTLSMVGVFLEKFFPVACGQIGCPAVAPMEFHLTLQFDDASLTSFHEVSGLSYDFFRPFKLASTVPAPAAAWLFGTSLLGLAGAARRKSRIK